MSAAVLIPIPSLHADILLVPDEYPTIQEAIDAAVAGDSIIVSPGTYFENIVVEDKNISIISLSGPSVTTIDGSTGSGSNHSCVTFDGVNNYAVLQGFTLTGGKGTSFEYNPGYFKVYGGGILCNYATPSIIGNVITSNVAVGIGMSMETFGGGIASKGIIASTVLVGNVIWMNGALDGGGIWGGNLFMINNVICYNYSGGIEYSTGTVMNSIIWGNSSPQILCPNLLVEFSDIQDGFTGLGNIDTDPLFEAGPLSDYHLSSASPCIDAGDPAPEFNDPEDPVNPGFALWPALGLLRNDMGAYGGPGAYFWVGIGEETGQVIPVDFSLIPSLNPFSESMQISVDGSSFPSELNIYDISGRLVRTLTSSEQSLFFWDGCTSSGEELPSGAYILRAESEGSLSSLKVLKLN